MAFVIYEARRRLAPNHVSGTSYSLPLSVADVSPPVAGALKAMPVSLNGTMETLYFGRERIWSVRLAPVQIHLSGLIYEFLESTDDGQAFTFDPYGSEDLPRFVLTVVRSDRGYDETSFQREGRGGHTDWVNLGFSVREA